MVIENKDRKALIEMTDEEIAAIVRGKANGLVDIFDELESCWLDASFHHLAPRGIYRLIPTYTPITVDWSVLDDDIQWIAADGDDVIYGYTVRPIKCGTDWVCDDCRRIHGTIKSLNRGDIPWDQSLIKRPTVSTKQEEM